MSTASDRTNAAVHHPLGDASNPQNLQDYLDSIDTSVAAKIGGSTGSNDNRLLRSDGTGGKTLQASGITVSDADAVSGVASLALGTPLTIGNGGTGASTATAAFDALAPTTTRGDVITRGASNNGRLALGSSGQVLSSDGTDAVWATQKVSVVAAGAVSSAATLDLTLGSADMYEIDLIAFAPATDNQALLARFSQSGSFLSGASDYHHGVQANGVGSQSEGATSITLSSAIGNNTNEYLTLTVRIFRPSASSFIKTLLYAGQGRTGNPTSNAIQGGGGLLNNTNAIDGVRFLFASANIASGYYAQRAYSFT
jgi:hypothetical protein